MNFGELVKTLRRERSLSQEDLAKLIGKSKSTICKIENNSRTPDLPLVEELSKAFGVHVSVLYSGNDNSFITPHEKEVIAAYRNLPDKVKEHVDFLLGVKKTNGDSLRKIN